jgi:hypothetical protein
MTTTLKVLGQAKTSGGANADVDAYVCGAANGAIVSSVVICNTGAVATYILKVRPAAGATDVKMHLASGVSLAANSTDVYTLGITLANTDVITFQASTTTVSCSVFGQENS